MGFSVATQVAECLVEVMIMFDTHVNFLTQSHKHIRTSFRGLKVNLALMQHFSH